jgi:hypothetical protein
VKKRNIFLISLLIIAGIICLILIYSKDLSSSESLLLSLFITIISVFCSWLISRHYAEHDFNKNLRMFALKASEKVNNLSNELDRLSVFLQKSPETSDYESFNEALLAKDLRIESAIHIISSLKSVNDGSLSDWQGVIGEELAAQKEEKEEREQDLRDLVDRLEQLYESNISSYANVKGQQAEVDKLRMQGQVDSLKNDINMLLTQVSGYPIRRKKTQKISGECPACNSNVNYSNKEKSNTMKGITCNKCKTRLYTVYSEGKSYLKVREAISENITCPMCKKDNVIHLDPLPGSRLSIKCNSCKIELETVRSKNNIIVRLPKLQVLTINNQENFIKKVEDLLPPQPWNKGIHIEIAQKLNVSHNKVGRAITVLIKRGVFKDQKDGVVKEDEIITM